jgi:hypothetical protein
MIRPYELLKPNVDEFGILASSDKGDSPLDYADACFTTYMQFNLGIISKDEMDEVFNQFRTAIPKMMILDNPDPKFYGLARRHCDTTRWFGQYNRMSRDQMHWMLGLALVNKTAFDAFTSNWSRRAFLFGTNTQGNSDFDNKVKLPDVTLFGMWAYFIRCRAISKNSDLSKLLRLALEILDLSLVANSLIRVYIHGKDRNETDSRNILKQLGLAKLISDTWCAKLARLIYKKMPIKFTERLQAKVELGEDGSPIVILNMDYATGAQQEVDDYFNSNGGVSGLAILWKPVVKWILS